MGNARILLVDDDPATAQTVGWVLRHHGYDVDVARTPGETLDALATTACDLVLLDVRVADGDGLDVVRQVRANTHGARVPLVVVGGDGLSEDAAVQALALGAGDVVRKPLRMRELLARIQARLRVRAAEQTSVAALDELAAELERVRTGGTAHRRLVGLLHELTGDLSADDIFHVLTRRLARALDLSHSAAILARPGDRTGTVVSSVEQPGERQRQIDLARYPEVRAALDRGRPVLVADVHTSPLLEPARALWVAEGVSLPARSSLAVPFMLERVQAGAVLLRRSGAHVPRLGADDAAFAETVLRVAAAALERARLIERTQAENVRLTALADTDPLTQTLNRRALTTRLATELERARRYDECLAVLIVDLDHFKRVNDTFGHLAGDEVLRGLAALLREGARSMDMVARFGGEEFVIVLPETPLDGALAFAERLRERIAGQAFGTGGRSRVRVTASVGVATFPAVGVEATADTLIARADAALYRAKEDGRNQVRS